MINDNKIDNNICKSFLLVLNILRPVRPKNPPYSKHFIYKIKLTKYFSMEIRKFHLRMNSWTNWTQKIYNEIILIIIFN